MQLSRTHKFLFPLWLALGIVLLAGFGEKNLVPVAPKTAKRPVTDVYHGVRVTDDYRWLENWNDIEVQKWSDAQNLRTRVYLDKLPERAAIRARLDDLINANPSQYFDVKYQAGLIFARKSQPPRERAMLVSLRSADDLASEKVIVDPGTISRSGSVSIDFYVPSIDGKLVAVSLSENGTEDGTARVFEVASGKELSDRVPGVNGPTAGGSIAWDAGGTGFYYTRYPQGNERPKEDLNFYQQVYFHKLGTDSRQDTYVIGKEFPRIAEIVLDSSDDGVYILASVSNGDGGEYAHYVMDAMRKWTQVTRFEDRVVSAKMGSDSLYLLSRKDAPRGKVLRVPLTAPELTKAVEIVAQSPGGSPRSGENARASIAQIVPTDNRLYVIDQVGGPSRVRIFQKAPLARMPGGTSITFRLLGEVPQPAISSVGEAIALGDDDVLLSTTTWLKPAAWYRLHSKTGETTRTTMASTSPISFDDAEAVREFATSKDGTRVPLNIIRKKGTRLDGNNPVLLEGYGGFGISMYPHFVGALGRIWLDHGGIYVIANLRGGGEYGEEWHRAGNLTRKQNVFDDFIAAAEYLIKARYTSPARLAILGGSNGGLLMGAALTQHPDLFRAVVSYVGIYDMLRAELDPNGVFNIPEFGSVKDPAQFKALYAYSPYHHVKNGTKYPAVLFATGANDGRVNPYHSRKMTARLQAANRSGHPILLRTSANTGHGGGSRTQAVEEFADAFAFLMDQLSME
jgi:prolyl oligopeptidase